MKIEYRHLNWMQLIWDSDLTANSKLFCAYIHTLAPGIQCEIERTGLSRKEAKLAIQELTAHGWIHYGINGFEKTWPEALL